MSSECAAGQDHRAPGGSTFTHHFISQRLAHVPALHRSTSWNLRFGTGEIQLGSSQQTEPFRWVLLVFLVWWQQWSCAGSLRQLELPQFPPHLASCWNAGQKHMLVGFGTSFQIVLIMCLNVQQKMFQCWAAERTGILSSPTAFGLLRSPPTASGRAHGKVQVLHFRALPER